MATDKSVIGELVHKRTRNSKTYLLSDGSHRAIINGGPVHYEDEAGTLRNINTALQDEADLDVLDIQPSLESVAHAKEKKDKVINDKKKGKFNRELFDYMAALVPYDLQLPRVWKRGYTIGKGADKITFKPVLASPAKAHPNPDHDNMLEYQDAWNDTDVTLQVLPIGIKETLILKSNEAPTTFRFEVTGLDTAQELQLQSPWLEDAAGVRRDVVQNITHEDGKTFVELVADVTELEYPVLIDPTVVIRPATDGLPQVETYVENRYSGDEDVNYGQYDWISYAREHDTVNDFYKERRALVLYDWASFLPSGSVVTAASLRLRHYSVMGYGAPGWTIHEILGPWDVNTVTYSTQPNWDATQFHHERWGEVYVGYRTIIFPPELMNKWIATPELNYGFMVRALYWAQSEITNWQSWHGFNCPGSTNTAVSTIDYKPYIEIDYIAPPTAPTVTSPNGGETWSGEHTITWNAATDPNGLALQYHIQLSQDNGNTWADIVALTAQGITSYVQDFSGYAESSTCLIRVRAYNGSAYGGYDQSDGVFAIQHNVAPAKPTNLLPSGGQAVDRAKAVTLFWQHNDSNGDPQSKYDLQWQLQGDAVWNDVTNITNLQEWQAPAGTFPQGTIVWRVRTYDQADLYSPYSDQAVFLAGDKPAGPIILDPADGGTVTGPTPTTQWSSSGQVVFQHQVLAVDDTLLWDSGEVISANKAQTVGMNLQNGTQYKIQVRIKNADGLWSDWTVVNITVAYTPPAEPTITTTTGAGYIQVDIVNPAPTGSQPAVARNEVWRKEGNGAWTRLVTNAGPSWRDYTAASGVVYSYKAKAVASTGMSSESVVTTETFSLSGVWLHDVYDPARTLHQFRRDGRSNTEDWDNPTELIQYDGRTYPVAQRDISERSSITLTLQMLSVDDTGDYAALKHLLNLKGTICYRDHWGNVMFGVIPTRHAANQIGFGQTITFTIHRIDYSEGV